MRKKLYVDAGPGIIGKQHLPSIVMPDADKMAYPGGCLSRERLILAISGYIPDHARRQCPDRVPVHDVVVVRGRRQIEQDDMDAIWDRHPRAQAKPCW